MTSQATQHPASTTLADTSAIGDSATWARFASMSGDFSLPASETSRALAETITDNLRAAFDAVKDNETEANAVAVVLDALRHVGKYLAYGMRKEASNTVGTDGEQIKALLADAFTADVIEGVNHFATQGGDHAGMGGLEQLLAALTSAQGRPDGNDINNTTTDDFAEPRSNIE